MGHFENLESRKLMAAGELDTTFSTGGRIVPQTVAGKELIDASNFATARDGSIYLAARYGDPGVGSNEFTLLTRYTSVGVVDQTYGDGGTVDFGDLGFLTFGKMAIDAHGRAYVLGSESSIGVTRLTPDGEVDPTWGTAGTTVLPQSFRAADLTLLNDGSVVLVGSYDANPADSEEAQGGVMKLNPKGRRDPTIKQNGGLVSGLKTIDFVPEATADDLVHRSSFSKVRRTRDGAVIVGGNYRAEGTDPNNPFNAFVHTGQALYKFDAGLNQLDFSVFQDEGNTDIQDAPTAMAVDRRGHVFIANLRQDRVFENDASLEVDDTFDGNDGVALTAYRFNDIEVQTNGKVFISANTQASPARGGVRRFNANGTVDKSFANKGWIYSNTNLPFWRIAVDSAGGILALDSRTLSRFAG